MTKNILFNIGTTIVTLIFISILLIKRFGYFPSGKPIDLLEKYTEFTHSHLHGWILDNPTATSVILYCKDRKGDMSHYQHKAKAIRDMGYKVIMFDYSGYGKSSGVPSEQQLYDDASMITSLIQQQHSPNQIIIWGEGMGAPIATHAAIRYRIPTLILDSPIPSINTLVRTHLGRAKFLALPFNEFNTAVYLGVYTGKSLLIHSVNNPIIPYETTLELRKLSTHHIPIEGDQDLPWGDIKAFIETSHIH